jgi:1,4-alpha-glucan branching enzyme
MDFVALTRFSRPGLHIWRPETNVRRYVTPSNDSPDADGFFRFHCELDASMEQGVQFKLYQRNEDDSPSEDWEGDAFNRTVPRSNPCSLPDSVWFAQESARVLVSDPRAKAADRVRIHLITVRRYLEGKLFIWSPDREETRKLSPQGHDDIGPYWDVDLTGRERHLFNFKFLRTVDGKESFEPDYANRLYSSTDGNTIWTHSEGLEVLSAVPRKKRLTVYFRQPEDAPVPAQMHLWQEASDFATDVDAATTENGWWQYRLPLYTGIAYRFKFHADSLPDHLRWEHDEAKRTLVLDDDRAVWTLEGDRHVFEVEPRPDRRLTVRVSHRPPASELAGRLYAHVWINRARWPLDAPVAAHPDDPNKFTLQTYPQVTTSFKFTDGQRWEDCARHAMALDGTATEAEGHLVLGRPPVLREPPPLGDLFADPPFSIRRPGVYQENGALRFILHAPDVARARVVGEWTAWEQRAVEMRSTRGGSYWWASVPLAGLQSKLPAEYDGDYHGAKYKFLLDDERFVQDPAAGWVEHSSTRSNSRLVNQSRFQWHDDRWQTPSWDYLTVYQIHPKRFTNRYPGDPPLVQVAKEIEERAGYLRGLGVTALLLMPVNEVGSNNSWGYDPAYFYAVERDYGGPDALKYLVDACHRNGMTVLLDVVFNHAGSDDNILWQVARDSFFDGDTRWGAMINFDHSQCLHFFAQNLAYWHQEFHIDGFRLDHTHTIVHSHRHGSFIREPGSGGGWEFLHGLRHGLHQAGGSGVILTAEHLPNEWPLTNFGGPMDSQWADDFHDRLVDACKGHHVMSRLAEAMKLGHTQCQQWYNVTNYPESHDEVGNVNDRIANVAGPGRGLRMSKVAAAASLMSRGIPMFFMGAEVGEHRQFKFGNDEVLDLSRYERTTHYKKVRAWWSALCHTHRNNAIKGPARLDVRFADGQLLAFSRGQGDDFFVVLNFGGWAGWKSLAELNLPHRRYRELWNSTWPAFAVEGEDEHTNGGRGAHLDRGNWLHIPNYGAVILERR